MQFQLVIQFRPTCPLDFDELVAIEDALIEELGDSVSVDGHDIGSGEFNVFIFTENPTGSFQRVQRQLQAIKPVGAMNVAYRDVDGEKYVVLWPPGLTEFNIA